MKRLIIAALFFSSAAHAGEYAEKCFQEYRNKTEQTRKQEEQIVYGIGPETIVAWLGKWQRKDAEQKTICLASEQDFLAKREVPSREYVYQKNGVYMVCHKDASGEICVAQGTGHIEGTGQPRLQDSQTRATKNENCAPTQVTQTLQVPAKVTQTLHVPAATMPAPAPMPVAAPTAPAVQATPAQVPADTVQELTQAVKALTAAVEAQQLQSIRPQSQVVPKAVRKPAKKAKPGCTESK